LRGYQQLPSVQEILLVAQDQARIEQLVRTDDGWPLNLSFGMEEAVELSSIGCRLALAQVYQGVELLAGASIALESPPREQ
jgi:Uma2 family endonuclease